MKKDFLTGLAILLPLALTIIIIRFLINVLTGPFVGLVSGILSYFHFFNRGFIFFKSDDVIQFISQLLVLVFLFFITIGLGILARSYFIKPLSKLANKILLGIPFVNFIYKTIQDIINTLFFTDKNAFKQVVLVEFPRKGVYALGLIARESPSSCNGALNKELISVLIPTTPNPTTGFLLMCKKEDLVYIDMKPEEAIKYIVSCGVLVPLSQQPSSTS